MRPRGLALLSPAPENRGLRPGLPAQRRRHPCGIWCGVTQIATQHPPLPSDPRQDDEALVRAFGEPDGLDLLSALKALEADFYTSDAHVTARDLTAMGDEASAEFRSKHPAIPDEVVAALAWCYTFDYK